MALVLDKVDQIAAEAEVSRNTVLRVLRGGNKESRPSAIEKGILIRRIAQRIGYIPNGSARAIRLGRFNCVGLLLSTDHGRSTLPDDLFDSILAELDKRGLRLVVSRCPDEKLANPKLLPTILRELCCDGLLINYTDRIPQPLSRFLRNSKLPSIWINSKREDDCVYYDDYQGAVAATKHLISQGHRKIAYLDFAALQNIAQIHYSCIDRLEGHLSVMKEAGLEPLLPRHFADLDPATRMPAIVQWLRSSNRPTAILCYHRGERMVFAALRAGLRVPEDLSIMSFGYRSHHDEFEETYIGKTLTRMILPVADAGRTAVNMLLERIERSALSGGGHLPASVLNLTMEPGGTCSTPRYTES